MAYFARQPDDEDDQQRHAQGRAQPVASAPPPMVQAPVQQAPAVQAAKAPVDTGRRFPLMGQYLSANKGMGAGMGGAVAGQVNQAADRAQGALKTAQDDFKKDVNKGTPSFQGPAAAGQPGMNTPPEGYGSGYSAGGYQPVRNDQGVLTGYAPTDAWKAYLSQPISYSGPQSIAETAGFGKAVGAVGNAADKAGATMSQGGIQSMLADAYQGNGAYSGGLSRLDGALVGQSGMGAISDARARFPGLSGALRQSVKDSEGVVGAAQSAAAAADSRRLEELRMSDSLDRQRREREQFLVGEADRNRRMEEGFAEADRKEAERKALEKAVAGALSADYGGLSRHGGPSLFSGLPKPMTADEIRELLHQGRNLSGSPAQVVLRRRSAK